MADSDAGRPRRILGRVAALVVLPALVLLHAWASLAIWYSPLPEQAWLRGGVALLFAIAGAWALFLSGRTSARVAYFVAVAAIAVGWSMVQPKQTRDWQDEVAVLPRATIDGDRVTIAGVRNFDYRSRRDFTPRFETREVRLSHLTGVDFYISFWMTGPIGHTFLSFTFDDAPPISISIETRPEKGQGYSPIASMFKQYELIYVVGEERDLVRVRTDYRDEDVFLYRIRATPERARGLFLEYLRRINELADRPEFYHLLSNSCTVNIVRYANASGRAPNWDVRHLLNGWIDRYFYEYGYFDTTMPFDELRARSDITQVAKAAGDAPDFSARIRANLPTIPR
jgi:hypothetical protein